MDINEFMRWRDAQPPEFFTNTTEAQIIEIYKRQMSRPKRPDTNPPGIIDRMREKFDNKVEQLFIKYID